MLPPDPELNPPPEWLIRFIHAVIIICGILLAAAFFTALTKLP
jgi:hypothetical protein